jgi:hypothetical protein
LAIGEPFTFFSFGFFFFFAAGDALRVALASIAAAASFDTPDFFSIFCLHGS